MNNCMEQVSINGKNSNILDIDIKNYGECGFCKENKEILNVDWNIYSQWLFLLRKMENKEWGGVLTIKDKIITEFKIPEQEVTSTECEFKEELGGNGIIHSHHNMGAFHSSQDDNHARNLYEYSIVISNEGIIAIKRRQLPCEGFGYTEVEVQIINPPNIELNKIKAKTCDIFYPSTNLSEYDKNFIHHQNFNKKEEKFICDMCMQDCSIEEQHEYMGGIICEECAYDLADF